MNAITSLQASAEVFDMIGNPETASFCRQMAEDCKASGIWGEPLYRHWASECAVKATAALHRFHHSHRDRSDSPTSGSGETRGEAAA